MFKYKNGYTFLKWAGAKSKLLSQMVNYLPKSINNYFEPFLGTGAMLFYLINTNNIKNAYVSDINKDLIITFKIVRDNVEDLIINLKNYKKQHNKEFYYNIRAQNPKTDLEIATRFIYLNKTCFNGLYRVNAKGLFNVPIGSYKDPTIVQEERLKKASEKLQKVNIKVSDYKVILKDVKKGDFVYLDPPYHPLENNSFTKYSKNDFNKQNQIELKEFCDKLDKSQINFMESNSYTPFIKKLYNKFNLNTILANRMINCKANGRGKIKEYLITNYEVN